MSRCTLQADPILCQTTEATRMRTCWHDGIGAGLAPGVAQACVGAVARHKLPHTRLPQFQLHADLQLEEIQSDEYEWHTLFGAVARHKLPRLPKVRVQAHLCINRER